MANWEELAESAVTGAELQPNSFAQDIADIIDEGLQKEFSPDDIVSIVSDSRGENAEGFADRFADQIESRLTERGYEISSEDVVRNNDYADTSNNAFEADSSSATSEEDPDKYDNLKSVYEDIKDKYLFRNVYVLSAKLEFDIEAYNQGKPGSSGDEVTGGDIAMDVLNLMRGDIFDSMLEIAIRDYFDKKYPGVTNEPDKVTVSDNSDVEKTESEDKWQAMDKTGSVRDDGYVKDVSVFNDTGINVESMRRVNPEYAEFRGADMTEAPIERDGMKIWNTGSYDKMTAISNGETESVSVPPIRLVELYDNHYHVDPFGKVVYTDTTSDPNALSIGDRIASLDISARRGGEERFETLASNADMTVDELKASITEKAEEKFISKIESSIDPHRDYLETSAIPDAKSELETYKSDLEALGKQKEILAGEYADLQSKADQGAIGVDDNSRMDEIEAKLKDNADATENATTAIERIESRIESLESVLEKYDEVKEQLAVEDGPTDGRFVAAAEASATDGRTENVYYVDPAIEEKVDAVAKEARHDIEIANANDNSQHDIVKAEEPNPDVANDIDDNKDSKVSIQDIEDAQSDEKREAQIDMDNTGIASEQRDRQENIADKSEGKVSNEKVDAPSETGVSAGQNANDVSTAEIDEKPDIFDKISKELGYEDNESRNNYANNESRVEPDIAQDVSKDEKQYIHYGSSEFDISKFDTPINEDILGKPEGGLWSSPVDSEASWERFATTQMEEPGRLTESFTFTLSDDARVYNISSVEDLKQLPISAEDPRGNVSLDFEKIAEDYDAISYKVGDFELERALPMWDVDTLLVLNPDVVVTDSHEADHVTTPIENETKDDDATQNVTNDGATDDVRDDGVQIDETDAYDRDSQSDVLNSVDDRTDVRDIITNDDAIAVAEGEAQQVKAESEIDNAPPESIQELVHGKDNETALEKDDTDGRDERDEKEELRDKLNDAFTEYIDTDFYSLQADFYPELSASEMAMLSHTNIMIEEFADIYQHRFDENMSISPTPGMSFGDLLHEIALVHDGSEMQTIDLAIDEVFKRNGDELQTEMFFADITEDLVSGMTDDVEFAVGDIDHMMLRFGGELYELTDNGLINAVTGETQDPEGMVERLVDYVSAEQSPEIGEMIGAMTQDIQNESNPADIVLSLDRMFEGYGKVVADSISELLDSTIYPDGREAFFENADLYGDSNRAEPHMNDINDIATEQQYDVLDDNIPDTGIEDLFEDNVYVDADALREALAEAPMESYDFFDPVGVEDYEDYGI